MDVSAGVGYLQADRILRIESPLGPDMLLPERMELREEISGLFEIAVALRSKRPDLTADEIVGHMVDVSLEAGDGDRRPWNGLVTELLEGPAITRGLRSYRLTIRPKLWLLSQTSDCRIWQDKTSLEVMETLLSEHGVGAAVTTGVVEAPAPEGYSVQYNETDLAYLTRRLETDGLFFWFEHEPGRHVLHVASYATGYTEGPQTDVRLAAGSTDRNHITRFEKRYLFTPGRRAGADWNFETPRSVPLADTPSLVKLKSNRDYELYEYPAKALDLHAGEAASKLRMQSVEADHERIEGGSTVRTLSPGRRFKPYDVAHPDQTYEEHVVTTIVHQAVDRSYETNEGQPEYLNSFVALPSRVPATPHRSTPRPRIDGAQVAVVAGPPGEEIHPDQYGRIKLWFPWDRRAKKDGTDTCWVRVMQSWAGGAWGAQVIPRIGMEVMVSYLEGDPDRPVVTGVVPNPDNQTPYELPANKTKTVFRTNTHKSKTPTQFNELSFEDEAGQEEVFIHAQRDMTIKVENHATERVETHKVVSVGGAMVTEVQRSDTLSVGQNRTVNIGTGPGGDVVRGGLSHSVFGIRDAAYFVSAAIGTMTGQGNYTLNAMGSVSVNAVKASTHSVGGAHVVTVGLVHTLNVGGSSFQSVGQDSSELVGDAKTIDAHGEILLRCGKSEIHMAPDGVITIKGLKLIVEEEALTKITSAKIELN